MRILAKTEATPQNPNTVSGCEFHRQYAPLEHLEAVHPEIKIEYCNRVTDEIPLNEFNLYHFIRKDIETDGQGNWHDAGNLQRVKDAQIPIVMDIDDYWKLDSTHALYHYYKQQNVTTLTENWLRQSDAIVTTTERLADSVAKINKNVHVIPNCIHPLFEQFKWSEPTRSTGYPVKLGWIGGIHHLNDIALWRDFFKKYWNNQHLTSHTEMYLGGYNDHPIMKNIALVMSGVTQKGKDNLKLMQSMDVFNYAKMYQNIDIALIPLADNTFNRCKSELKIVEAGYFGIPVICSDIYPYNTIIEHGYNGYLVRSNKPDIIMKYVNELVNDDVLRYHMGQNLKQTVNDRFNINEATQKRYDLFRGLCK